MVIKIFTYSKSETTIKRSGHGKFNCITVKYNGTWHGIYIILEVHLNSLYKYIPFNLLQNSYNSLLMGIKTLYDAKEVKLNRIFSKTLCSVKLSSEDYSLV